jgi:capsular polysaccharide biosynthesis protein/MinD-like ATPase involved in chromosome partitioning or flagellar assembly
MPADESARSLSDYLAIFRRRWWLTALVALLTVGAAALYTIRQPTMYRAVEKIVVGQSGTFFDPRLGNVADQFTQTMSDLLQSDIVARQVISNLNLDMTPRELLANLHVITKPETAVLVVTYDDTDPERGVAILHEVGEVFTQTVDARLTNAQSAEFAVSVTVFDDAHSIPDPVAPTPLKNLVVAAALGILLGLLAAVIAEQLDDTIRGVDQAEAAFGQTATATLPQGIVGFQPFGQERRRHDPLMTELSLQRLRASVLWTPDADDTRTLLVTSAGPEEGKTTISANLAVLMVTEGRNVILVEGDLRQPALHRYLGLPPLSGPRGFGAVLRGDVPVRNALVDVPVPARAYAAAGETDADTWNRPPRTPAPGRLRVILASPKKSRSSEISLARAQDLMAELRDHADVVIFDSAPILIVPDAYPLVAAADMVVAVVRANKTHAKAASDLSRRLERIGAKRVELVVTDAEPSYGGASYYGYGRRARDESSVSEGAAQSSSAGQRRR